MNVEKIDMSRDRISAELAPERVYRCLMARYRSRYLSKRPLSSDAPNIPPVLSRKRRNLRKLSLCNNWSVKGGRDSAILKQGSQQTSFKRWCDESGGCDQYDVKNAASEEIPRMSHSYLHLCCFSINHLTIYIASGDILPRMSHWPRAMHSAMAVQCYARARRPGLGSVGLIWFPSSFILPSSTVSSATF